MKDFKAVILTFYMLFFSILLFSQDNKNYISYHQTCRKAEHYFIDSNYRQCIQTYDSLFKKYDFLFPRDCFTAAQLANKIGDDSMAVVFLKKGVPFGLNADMFIKTDTALQIHKIYDSKYWINYKRDYDSLRKLYVNRVDWNLKKKIEEMVSLDQQIRIKNNKWFNRIFRKGLENDFNIVNQKHIAFLDSVFKIKGYPGIWLTGVGDSSNGSFNYNGNLSEIFFVILYHYDSAYVKFGDFLRKEIETGHIHPRVYAMTRDFQDRWSGKREKHQEMYYNIWWEKANYTKKEYAQHCHDIGCPTKNLLRGLFRAGGYNTDFYWWPFR